MPRLFLVIAAALSVVALAILNPVGASLLGLKDEIRVTYTRPEVVLVDSYGSDAYGGSFVARRVVLDVDSSGAVTGCTVGVYCYQGGLLGVLCIAAVNVTLYDSSWNVLAYNSSAALVLSGRYTNVTVAFDGSVSIGEVHAVVVEALG